MTIKPADPRLERAAEARAIAGFRLLREVGFKTRIVVPLGTITVAGPPEDQARADEVVELFGSSMRNFATWVASGLGDVELLLGSEIFESDSSDGPALCTVQRATLEDTARAFADHLRAPRGLSLRRRDANEIARALTGLTETLRAERAARRA